MERIARKLLYMFFRFRVWYVYRKKIKNISTLRRNEIRKILPNLTGTIREHKSYLKNILGFSVNILWIKTYTSISGKVSPLYIPEDIYYLEIEPRLNNYSLARSYSDKNFYERFFTESKDLFVTSLIRRINGIYYDSDFNPLTEEKISSIIRLDEKHIIKPSIDSGGGKGVLVIEFNKGNNLNESHSLMSIFNSFSDNFVLQNFIRQNTFFSQFNLSSVNTIRLLTYRSVVNNEVSVIQGVLRIGKAGSHVDNQASGGVACGFDLDTGKLNDYVSDKYGNVYASFNNIDLREIRIIPDLDTMKKIAKSIASGYDFFRLISFDFCVDEDNRIKIIELNTKNHEINFYQFNNGPLFGKHTDEILKYCSKRKKSFVLDYEI